MLYTRMLFSCLVDADYTASAMNDESTYLDHAEDDYFAPQTLLEKLYAYRNDIKQHSTADQALNSYRDQVFEQCGKMGSEPEGLYTLTAPTGTGKTLALLHFALRHCLKHGKKRIIIVLPFLTLAEQSAKTYSQIIPNVLIDHSQSNLPESARELAARWSSPVIITTSVRFFESLFSDRPAVCRKPHNIANSVVIFDEAQSLPADLTSATLRAVNELCGRYHTTVVFSTATQPDFSARKGLAWAPREIFPENKKVFATLQRVEVEWRIGAETPLETIAEEMSRCDSVCVIVNLPFGLYEVRGFVSANLAEETGFDEADLNILFESILNMYEHDHSASKGEMSAVSPLILFKHVGTDSDAAQRARQARLGCAPAHKLFDLVVSKKASVAYPRSYRDYDAMVSLDQVPNGVQIGFRSSAFGPVTWGKLPEDEDWFHHG